MADPGFFAGASIPVAGLKTADTGPHVGAQFVLPCTPGARLCVRGTVNRFRGKTTSGHSDFSEFVRMGALRAPDKLLLCSVLG